MQLIEAAYFLIWLFRICVYACVCVCVCVCVCLKNILNTHVHTHMHIQAITPSYGNTASTHDWSGDILLNGLLTVLDVHHGILVISVF